MSRKNLAIIPARGGSKGIPRKNLQPLDGRPLLAHSLEQARDARAVDRVIVSTDDQEIAEVSRRYGAEVVSRPAELAGDTASSESALLHALDVLRERENYEPDLVVFLQATSPLRHVDDIDQSIALLERKGADSLFSACSVHGFIWRRLGEDLQSVTYDHTQRQRRQDLDVEDYLENGSIYVFRPWVLREHGNRLGGRMVVYPMDPLHSFQIDEPADLELMEGLCHLERERQEGSGIDLSAIRLLVLDFDGVLTNNRVIVHQDGTEAVVCDRGDSLGLGMLREAGQVEAVVLSKEINPVVSARCQKLRLECFQGSDDKLTQLEEMVAARGLAAAQVAYVGNDVNDLEAMSWSGVAIAVADAVGEVRAVADFVTRRSGGQGAVREVCDLLLANSSYSNSRGE